MSGGTQNSLRKALGALKDTTTVSLAKVNSGYKVQFNHLQINFVGWIGSFFFCVCVCSYHLGLPFRRSWTLLSFEQRIMLNARLRKSTFEVCVFFPLFMIVFFGWISKCLIPSLELILTGMCWFAPYVIDLFVTCSKPRTSRLLWLFVHEVIVVICILFNLCLCYLLRIYRLCKRGLLDKLRF